ncbi:MAG: aldo/keto reductase [Elusimicrobia bacterium RIFOXYB2_FULL_48_7]|nr:MAG: aldo/keto reductase [Elusimicrobia bacterium RIFOXYB2_FULL_48_7]
MRTRKLGWTDLNLTVIGLGTWAIGGAGWKYSWGPQDDKDSIAAIRRAVALGINWIDTAAAYGLGHSEEILAKALEGLRDKVIVATKCSRLWDTEGNLVSCLKKESIRRELENSLRRLKTDVIDLYQVHWPSPEEDLEDAWAEIGKMIKEGKIRYAGVSNFNTEQMKRCNKIHPIASLQPPYSMLRRDIEKEILGFCAENKIGVVVYSPLQKGLLTGKFTEEVIKNLSPDDNRHNDPYFHEPKFGTIMKFINELKGFSSKKGRAVQELAIAWVLRRPEVTSAIVGARCPSQVEENVKAGDWVLSESEIGYIEKLMKECGV